MKKILVGLCLVFGLAAWGQNDPPTNSQLKSRLENPDSYFYITRPDGVRMTCVQYGSGTDWTNQSKSWFAFTCDWSGKVKKS